MNHVEWVRSTIKGGCDVTLGPKTVIYGPNGSGKSTIVQAIELATKGLVSDMEGREQVKQHTALARLFPSGAEMVAACGLSDGTNFEWKMEPKKRGKGFKKPAHSAPKAVRWLVQELRQVLAGGDDKVSTWLEEQVLGSLEESDILRPLPPEVREDVKALMAKTADRDFLKLSKAAKDAARRLRTAATRSEKTIDAMVEGVNPPLLDEEREALEAQREELAPKHGAMTQEEYKSLEAAIQKLASLYSNTQAKMSQLAPVGDDVEVVLNKLTVAVRLIQQHRETFGAGSSCWVCGSTSEVPNWQLQAVSEALGAMGPQVEATQARQQLAQQLSTIEQQLKLRIDAHKAAVVAPNTSVEREAIIAKLAADDAAKRTWRNAEANRAEVAQSRARADRLTTASKALKAAGKQLLEKRKKAFSDDVSAYLPSGEELGVDLSAARLGLQREDQLHTALSGAEWSRVLLALASAGPAGSTPCVLVPEDRAWDRDTLGSVMEALSASPVQVIIMSTVKPEPVEGWTVVNLS